MLWTLRLALAQLFPFRTRFPFYSILSTTGITLGVGLLIIVQAIMFGFGREYQTKIIDTSGHVQIVGYPYFEGYEEVMAELETDPRVVAVTPFVYGKVMILHRDMPAFPEVRGSDHAREPTVIAIDDFIRIGEWDDLDDGTVLLSSGLASQLNAVVGSRIEVYSPLMIYRFQRDEVFMPRELEVAGIFHVGWHDFDNNTMVMSIRQLQELMGLENEVHGISIRLTSDDLVDFFAADWSHRLPDGLQAFSWMDVNSEFLWVLSFERQMMSFLLVFVILVSSFAIVSSLLNHVVEKTREIGLLRSLGATPGMIAMLFCAQGLFIGICGTALGILFGSLVVHNRQSIVEMFAHLTQSREIINRFYQFIDIPAQILPSHLIQVTIITLVLTFLASLIPAIQAALINPAQALRDEI